MLLIWIYPLGGMLLIQTVYFIYESRSVAFISRADDRHRLCLSGKVEVSSGSKCAAVCFSLNETRRYVSEGGGGGEGGGGRLREWRLN